MLVHGLELNDLNCTHKFVCFDLLNDEQILFDVKLVFLQILEANAL